MVRQHVHLAILHSGHVRAELSAILNAILLKHRCGFAISIRYGGNDPAGRPTCSNRNRIIREAPEDADHILMFDSDVKPPPDVLGIMKFDKDIISCPSPIWRPMEEGGPVITNVVPLDGKGSVAVGDDELLECKRVGGGVYGIAKRVYTHPEMRGAFANKFDEDGVNIMSADYVYCDKARALGFRCWAALGYPLGHVKSVDLVSVHDAVSKART